MSPTAPRPPKVKCLPVLGHSPEFYRDAPNLFRRAYQEYGPICRLSIFGVDTVLMAGTDAIDFYVKNEAELFTAKHVYEPMPAVFGTQQSLLTTEGADHKHLRKELGPGFSRQLIADAVPGMVQYAIDEAKAWTPGTQFDALSTMSRLLVQQASRTLLAMDFTAEQHRDIARFVDIYVAVGVNIMPKVLYWVPSYRRAKKLFIETVNRVVRAERARPAVSGCPLNLLRVSIQRRRTTGELFDDHDAAGFAAFPVVMNAVYTNRMCAYALYELLRHPEVMARVQAEVDAVITSGDWSMPALQRMTVLRAALLETLRLYPLIVGLPRHATNDFEFKGHAVRKGDKVLVGLSVTQLLPEYFPNPLEFDPDRMLPPRSEQHQPRVFSQYGYGAHRCLGLNVAEMLALATLTGLLGTVAFEPADPGYVAKRISNPLPGPEGFRLRVRGPRTPVAPAASSPQPLENEDASLLKASEGLPREVLARVMAQVRKHTVAAGATIYRPGDEPLAFYTILEGRVRLTTAETPAEPAEVTGHFGEAGLLDRAPRGHAATAVDEVQLLAIEREAFHEIVGSLDLTAPEIAALVRHRAIVGSLASALPQLHVRQIAAFAPRTVTHAVNAREVIVRQGDAANHFYILLKGEVEVVNEFPGRKEIPLARLEPGQYFGEIGLLENRPRSATVRAGAEGAHVVAFDRESFFALMRESKETETAIAQNVVRRLASLAGRS